jgi:hypothetical protein
VIDKPGYSLAARNILRDQLPPGSVPEPRLSYDGRRILFAFVACSDDVPEPASLPVNCEGSAERYFHLYEVNVDGTGLRQLTDSNKIVFIGSAHHAITAGRVCVVAPSVDANSLDAVSRITPLPFPEAEGKLDQWYAAPWPLSEETFLVAYSPHRLRFQGEHRTNPNPDNALVIYLLDAAGNRELLYRDPDISTTNPTPLTRRPRSPIVAASRVATGRDIGTMVVTDIYQGLGDVPRGTVKELRMVQVFPKSTWLANQPRMGVAGEENGRAILGSVPVEADGSACFEVPAGKLILFHVLDAQGMAYQTMRSLTFDQPGEQTSCVGCHDPPDPPFERRSLRQLAQLDRCRTERRMGTGRVARSGCRRSGCDLARSLGQVSRLRAGRL